MFQRMQQVYSRLQDDESKALFNIRLTYTLNHNEDEFIERINSLYTYDQWISVELEERMAIVKPKGIIIFGCGHDGKLVNRLLDFWKYKTSYFCDNRECGGEIDGIQVISVEEVIKKYKEYLVVIGSSKYGTEMFVELVQKGFPYSNIVLSSAMRGIPYATRGKQYFDMFEPKSEEIYIDAGTFDGETILDFVQWTKGSYKKIYAFEPIRAAYEAANRKMIEKNVERIEFMNGAVWNQKEKLPFYEDGFASSYAPSGKLLVQGMDIDSIVNGENVTFIKMDVEGSELNAIKGARNTILNSLPRLAICVYHKPMDIIEIPYYLLSLVPEYKFYIRHYRSNTAETVLYAVP